MLPDCLVLGIEYLPTVSYPLLVNGFGYELLDMEPVIDKRCAGKQFLTVSIMAEERSVVTVFTLRRCLKGIFRSIADTVSLATPRTIAARAPLPPCASLLVSMV